MRSIESIASKVPYMTVPGNHEHHDNFSHYDARFSMIGDRDHPHRHHSLTSRLNNHFYSLTLGPARIIMFNSEFYFFTKFGWDQIREQYEFLERELKKANEDREEHPWVIVMGHRPMYCLKVSDDYDCDNDNLDRIDLRQGVHWEEEDEYDERVYGLEKLFYDQGVDLFVFGHEHFYARFAPVYDFQMLSGSNPDNPYDNPNGPVHILTGSAVSDWLNDCLAVIELSFCFQGNFEEHPEFNPNLKDFVLFHAKDYGYTRLNFIDTLHIQLQQVSVDQNGDIIDSIDLIKRQNKPNWMN